jgi:hypothetical protein
MSTTSDLIVALQTAEPWDIAHSEELHTLAAARLDELERENAVLKEALKPFAEKARDYRHEDPAHHGIVLISDLRRAAALAGSGEK